MFTKVLTWDQVNRHMETMKNEFVGRSALDILERKVDELVGMLKLDGKVRTWVRTDLGTRTAKSTMRGGPDYTQVVGRVAVDATSGEVLIAEDLRRADRAELHKPIGAIPRDIVTGVIFLA